MKEGERKSNNSSHAPIMPNPHLYLSPSTPPPPSFNPKLTFSSIP